MYLSTANLPNSFEELSESQKHDEQVQEHFFNKCAPHKISSLFKQMPEAKKRDDKVLDRFLNKCNACGIPKLFEEIPEARRQDDQVLDRFLNKCNPHNIPSLFMRMPEGKKHNDQVLDRFLSKCQDIHYLFEVIPEARRHNDQVLDRFFNKCHAKDIPNLFEVIPEARRHNDQVLDRFFNKCSGDKIPNLFEVIPEARRQDDQVLDRFLNKCDADLLPELFMKMLEVNKHNDQVQERFVHRCPEWKLFDLFETLPTVNKHIALLAIERMPFTELAGLEGIKKALPLHLQSDPDIERAIEKKDLMTLSFMEKYHELFRAAFHLIIVYALMVAPVECVFWYASQSGNMKQLRWKHWGGTEPNNYERVSFEVMPGCPVGAAPQPFAMSVAVDSSKLLIVTAALGFTARNLMKTKEKKEETWKAYLFVAMMAYSILMIPATFISVTIHYAVDIYPNMTGFLNKGACFYALLNVAGPFQSNYLMYFLQFCVSLTIGQLSETEWASKMWSLVWFSLGSPKEGAQELAAPLLRTAEEGITLGEMHDRKMLGKWYLFLLTMLPYIILEIPFILMYKLVALVCFFPFVLLLILFSATMFACVNMQKMKEVARSNEKLAAILYFMMYAEQAGYLPLVPLIWGLSVINQFLTLAPIYWMHNGEGWYSSAITVLMERNIAIYSIVFFTKITSRYWSAIAFVNECT